MYLRNDKHENLLLGRKHKDSFIHKSDKIIVLLDNQFELSPFNRDIIFLFTEQSI
jgi:hypothetical protein